MAHHKRRKRRKGGIKGCCLMCSYRTTNGLRNGRLRTVQEQRSAYGEHEQTSAPRPQLNMY